MSKQNYGRHLPAFILLFLAKGPTYGSMLLNLMDQYLPYKNADGPAVYRALKELEKEKAVESTWDTSAPGAAKKCYTITDLGLEQLKQFKVDIEQRKRNFDFFLSEFDNLGIERQGENL